MAVLPQAEDKGSFSYFTWPPLEAALMLSKLRFLFTRAAKLLFVINTLLGVS